MDALAAIAIVLASMVVSIGRRANIAVTVLIGIILTSILFGKIGSLPSEAVANLLDLKTVSLMLMVCLVFLLNNFLSAAGAMKKSVAAIEKLVSDQRATIALIPSLIGLMPSPSGAVLSAPFANEIGAKANLTRERRLLINYWFRHISEYVNPVYPGVIVATGILGVSFYSFFASNLPIMAFYVFVGLIFYVLSVNRGAGRGAKASLRDISTLVRGVSPIILAVLLPVVINVDLTVALIAAIALSFALNAGARVEWKKLLKESFKYDLIVLVYLIMLFKLVLDESGAASQMSTSLIAAGAPTLLLLILLPMTAGFLTGLTIGYVGLAFPIILPFIEASGKVDMGLATLAFVSGYLGVLLSPMHLCLAVTREYFRADFSEVYRQLYLPVALTLLWTIVYVLVL